MVVLSLGWILIGVGIGALAVAAGWGFAVADWSQRTIWLATMGLGSVTALLGGWVGNLCFDRYYTTPTALWVSVVSVVVIPRLIAQLLRRGQTV